MATGNDFWSRGSARVSAITAQRLDGPRIQYSIVQ